MLNNLPGNDHPEEEMGQVDDNGSDLRELGTDDTKDISGDDDSGNVRG